MNPTAGSGGAIAAGGSPGTGGSGAGGSVGTGGAPGPGGLDLAPPGNGIQVTTVGLTIQPGEDVEHCEIVALPGGPDDEYFIDRVELQMTEFSHHLNVRAVVPDTEADFNSSTGQVEVCLNNGGVPYGQGFKTLAGSQERYALSTFPPGVGYRLTGGQKIMFNYHYLNTGSSPVPARSLMNLHFAPPGSIDRTVYRFGMYNLSINIPPRSEVTHTMECRMNSDVMVHGLARHTHQWGTDFHAWFAGGARDGEFVFTSRDYDRGQGHLFADPVLVRAGEGFRFECNHNNTTDGVLTFGDKATEEMCILYGQWFVVNPGDTPVSQDCIALNSDGNNFASGFPCAQCPDGQLF